jgi:general secretion pathway protein D
VILNALSDIIKVNVISSPQLMVLNNQSARLQVGDQVPIAVQSAVSVTDPDAPIVNAIEFRDTGVILDVIPRVNAGGLVVLDIAQEVSDVVETTSSTLNSPTIRQRRIESTVAVQSGETIALGGLIRDSKTDREAGMLRPARWNSRIFTRIQT